MHMLELPNHGSDAVMGSGSEIPEIMFFIKKAHERFDEIKSAPYLDGIPVVEAVQFEKAFDGIISATKKHNIDLVVDRLVIKKGIQSRLADSIALGLKWGKQNTKL